MLVKKLFNNYPHSGLLLSPSSPPGNEYKSGSDDNEEGWTQNKQHIGQQRTRISVNLGGCDETDFEYANEDTTSDKDSYEDETRRTRNFDKGLPKRMFDNPEDEEDEDNEDDQPSLR
jgi:hypothetical protein